MFFSLIKFMFKLSFAKTPKEKIAVFNHFFSRLSAYVTKFNICSVLSAGSTVDESDSIEGTLVVYGSTDVVLYTFRELAKVLVAKDAIDTQTYEFILKAYNITLDIGRGQGTKEPRNQGTKEPRNQGAKGTRGQGSFNFGGQGTLSDRHPDVFKHVKDRYVFPYGQTEAVFQDHFDCKSGFADGVSDIENLPFTSPDRCEPYSNDSNSSGSCEASRDE